MNDGAPGFRPDFEPLRTGRNTEVWDVLARWRAERRRFVLATVVEARGFTPRKGGTHMLIAGSGETWGTIGGGAIEREVLENAAVRLREGNAASLRRHLTQDLGMCCGGEMTVFLELVEPAPALWIFGGGYIAKPLAAMAAGCGFDVTVVDARPDWAHQERFPGARLRVEDPADVARALVPGATDSIVIVTHDHALDQRVVQHLLARPCRFIGMVGSIPKQRKFALRLRARGFSDDQISRLRTPLGLDIGADTPEEIAVSIVAELVAVRRGASVPAGWTPRPAAPAGPAAMPAADDDTSKSSNAANDAASTGTLTGAPAARADRGPTEGPIS